MAYPDCSYIDEDRSKARTHFNFMTSDSLNTDLDINDQVPDPLPRPHRYAIVEPDGNADSLPMPDPPADRKYRDNFESKFENSLTPLGMVWPGIVFSLGCLPVVIGIVTATYLVFFSGFQQFPANNLATAFASAFAFAFFGFFVAIILAIVLSVPAFLLTQLLCWGFSGNISTRGAVGIFGGMTGFLCIFVVSFFNGNGIPGDLEVQELVFGCLILAGAAAVGHFGAFWAGFLGRFDGFPFFEPVIYLKKRVTIRFFFRLTVLVAALAIIFKQAGLYIAILWSVYLLVQLLLLVCDHWFTRLLGWSSRFVRM